MVARPRTSLPVLAAALLPALLLSLPLAPGPRAAPLRDVPVQVRQPDGTLLDLRATGDEARRRLHDADGYTVVRDPATSRAVYATLRDGRLAPTALVPGRDDPRALRVAPGIDDPPAAIRAQVAAWQGARPRAQRSAPRQGTLNNIVLFVRFADEAPLATPVKTWEDMLNSLDPATPSLRAYYREASYGALDVVSHMLPRAAGATVASYQDQHPRAHYQKRDPATNPGGYTDQGDAMVREQQMVRRALEATVADLPPGTDLDGDDDGFVDNLCVVVAGKPDGWSDLLWPHMSLQLADLIYLDDLVVLTYNLQLNDTVLDRSGVGVLAHELFHTLGAPDLYHYSDDNRTPAGPWDLMEWDLRVPQHMSSHMKARYGGWLPTAPLITESGTYVLNPLTSPRDNAWRLPVPGQPKQFVQVEYRRREGAYESQLPAEGLVFWRVDERWWGNNDGPPDELHVFRPGGSPTKDGEVRKAPLSAQEKRTEFGPDSDPWPFDQQGNPVGVRVTAISEAGGPTMSFTVCMAYATCFLKECGDDGCGGTCGTCAADRVCQDRMCVAEQRCDTAAACVAGCGTDEACATACLAAPVRCPDPLPCHGPGQCDVWNTGTCSDPLLSVALPCDDGDPCTLDDACDGEGHCLGALDPACLVPDPGPADDATAADVPARDVPGADEGGAAPDAAEDPAPEAGVDEAPDAARDTLPADAAIDAAHDTAPGDGAPSDLPPAKPNAASGCTAAGAPSSALPLLLPLLAWFVWRRRG